MEKKEAGILLPRVFTFNPNNQEVRVEIIENAAWFVAKDICDALSISNNRDAVDRLDEDEKLMSAVPTLGVNRGLWLVNESGLYSLIFQSRKPEAKSFRKWVTSEVLPAIRKNGRYELVKPINQIDSDVLDLRHIPYEFRQVNGGQVRMIVHNDVSWYSINDLMRSIGSCTCSVQIVSRLNRCGRTLAVKIAIFGNTHPAWFTTITGAKLLFSGSRKIKGLQNANELLKLTMGGLV